MHRPAGLRAQDARAPGERRDVGEGRRGVQRPLRGARRGARQLAPTATGSVGLSTAAGDVTLKIPKLRRGSFFPEDLIERYCRVDRALVAAVAEMYVMGISTRKVEAVAGRARRRGRCRSRRASRLCERLDAEVDAFRRQRFDGVRFAYLSLERRLREVPRGGALGVPGRRDRDRARRHGPQALRRRGLRGRESHAGWKAFLSGLERGVDGVRLVLSTPRRAREGDGDVPRSGLAALRHAPHAHRSGPASTGRTTRERRARP